MPFRPLDPGSGMGKNKDPDPDEKPGSYLRELRKQFFGLKILKFVDGDPDPGSGIFSTLDPRSADTVPVCLGRPP